MHVIERYSPLVLGVNSVTRSTATGLCGFLCITSGAITVAEGDGTTIINSFPCTAGTFYPMPFRLHHSVSNGGATITTTGGASGTIGLS